MNIIHTFSRLKKQIIAIIIIFFVAFLFSRGIIFPRHSLEYGLTFSVKQARDLGFDPQEVFLAMLDDLQVKKLRLSAYWDEIQPDELTSDFSDLDWQINEAAQRNVEIILAVGGRLPRWPECHFPEWVKGLEAEERKNATMIYIEKVIARYQDVSAIKYWQVENEPFLSHFGECPEPDADFLDEEIALVRSMDKRPIIVTDSGELSLWVPAAKRADIFGTTMYRDTYSEVLKHYVHYPLEPGFFRFKKNITRWFANPQKWVVIELQAEPWGPRPFQDLSKQERERTMSLPKLKDMIEFSSQTGFQEFYLWGVEWWYWEKETKNNDSLWEYSKTLFVE